MQIPSFDWFVGREKGRPCLVAGTAPTATDFPYLRFNGVYVTCGDGPVRFQKQFKADYWVNANNIFPVPEKHLALINSFRDTVFIFSDSVAYCYETVDPDFLRDNLKVNWFPFDQRHFGGKPCGDSALRCCKLLDIYPGRLTLQEYMQARYHRDAHYSAGSTVAVHALAFAILMGCSPIYLQGIELPRYEEEYIYKPSSDADKLSQQGYLERLAAVLARPALWPRRAKRRISDFKAKYFRDDPHYGKSPFYYNIPLILNDFEYLLRIAAESGLEVFNLSKTSSLNSIPGLKVLDPSQVNHE